MPTGEVSGHFNFLCDPLCAFLRVLCVKMITSERAVPISNDARFKHRGHRGMHTEGHGEFSNLEFGIWN